MDNKNEEKYLRFVGLYNIKKKCRKDLHLQRK